MSYNEKNGFQRVKRRPTAEATGPFRLVFPAYSAYDAEWEHFRIHAADIVRLVHQVVIVFPVA